MLKFVIVLLLCQLAGDFIMLATGLPLPGPVIGMALLFTGLSLRGEAPAALQSLSDSLLSHLSLLFVPAGVGVMLHADLIGAQLLPIAGSVVIATLTTMVLTGWLMQRLNRRSNQA